METLEVLSKFFFGGEAEAEAEIRNNVFVSPSNLKSLLSFNRARYKVLLGSKGVGKSLLLNVMNESILEERDVSILLTPKDFDCEKIARKATNSDKISAAYNQLLIAIAAKLGTFIDFAVSDSEVNLQKLAIEEGMTRADMISRVASFLPSLIPSTSKVANAAKELQQLNKKETILKTDIARSLSKNKNKIWILMDDVDQASIEKQGNYDYSVCWAIVAAIVDLANDFNDIRCMISVRTDIWHTMTVNKKLGSDRLDKMQEPDYLRFNESEIKEIFRKRLSLANKEVSGSESDSTQAYFSGEKITLPGTTEILRSWEAWIAKLARNRPRDMVHLVQELIESSEERDGSKINTQDAYDVMLPFAKSRIKNIETEYREICPQTKAIINNFATKNKFSFQSIISDLKGAASARSTAIDGKVLNPDSNETAIAILKVLHMSNFINARHNLNPDGSEYEHITYDERPFLVDMANWNELQKYEWEIHPAFHSYVEELRKNKRSWLV
ncbi:P-loop ATPase, Sll1717 family [Pseudoalteromonas rubra]|uniref:P-loop ATPase, Sll1717 family n=1 Tax=Pseudoalteromonas rubra TaxID=43658 RepID=UPI000AA5203F|nr:hypothetical protein [Pseudoalteromonas rubra]